MGKLKNILQEEKRNMPEYQYNFLYKKVMPGFIFVLGGALFTVILTVIFALTTNQCLIPIVVSILWGLTTIVLLVLLVINSRKLSKRLINDKTQEFEKKYKLVDYDKAVQHLSNRKIIKNSQILINDQYFPIDDCVMEFKCKTLSGAFYFNIIIAHKDNLSIFTAINLDKNSCTYFYNLREKMVNKDLFVLFVENKKRFLELLFRYNNEDKMSRHL